MITDLFQRPPVALELRDYQHCAVAEVEQAFASGARAPLLVAPTASGKTVIASELIRREVAAGGRALFIAPRRELIHQSSRTLRETGTEHGVILAGAEHLHAPGAAVQVASLDTLQSRITHRGLLADLPDFSLILIDEAHLFVTAKRSTLLNRWPARRIGLTATPIRKDGRALGVLFDRLIEVASVATLTSDGFLVPGRYFSLSEPDLARVSTTAGDYNQRDLDDVVNTSGLVGDIIEHWLHHAADRRTAVFCTSVAHSVAVTEAFQRSGVTAEHVDASTPTDEREVIFQRFTSGATQVLTNVLLASYGFDLPALSCIVLARPTKSLMLYLQMVGRGLRPASDKSDCLVLDHSGAVHRHGFAHERRAWSLDGHKDLSDPGRGVRGERGEPRQIDCPECRAVFAGTTTCPECGYRIPPRARDVETLDGELVELGQRKTVTIDRREFYAELRGLARERGYSLKWPAAKFRDRFGVWPPFEWNRGPVVEPTLVTRRWVMSQQIAFGKSRRRRAGNRDRAI